MAKKQCFMPFFYDWYNPFSALNGNDAKKLLLAMVTYYQNGGEIPEFTGKAKIAADFVFPQLVRAKEAIKQRSEAGIRSAEAARERNATNSQRTATTNTNTNTTTNTNTNTITNTIINTDTNTITNTNPNTTDDLCEGAADDVGCVSVSDSRFDIFWEIYPKKQNKATAKQIWHRLDPDDALFRQMLDALEWQKKSPAWTVEEGRYIPAPSTWLSRSRWQDEPSTVGTSPVKESCNQSAFDANDFFEAALRRSMAVYGQTSSDQDGGK